MSRAFLVICAGLASLATTQLQGQSQAYYPAQAGDTWTYEASVRGRFTNQVVDSIVHEGAVLYRIPPDRSRCSSSEWTVIPAVHSQLDEPPQRPVVTILWSPDVPERLVLVPGAEIQPPVASEARDAFEHGAGLGEHPVCQHNERQFCHRETIT
jgi:hypothetical protein